MPSADAHAWAWILWIWQRPGAPCTPRWHFLRETERTRTPRPTATLLAAHKLPATRVAGWATKSPVTAGQHLWNTPLGRPFKPQLPWQRRHSRPQPPIVHEWWVHLRVLSVLQLRAGLTRGTQSRPAPRERGRRRRAPQKGCRTGRRSGSRGGRGRVGSALRRRDPGFAVCIWVTGESRHVPKPAS